jgi:chitodextrinase
MVNRQQVEGETAPGTVAEPDTSSGRLLWVAGGAILAALLSCVCIVWMGLTAWIYLDATAELQPDPTEVVATVPAPTSTAGLLPEVVIVAPQEATVGELLTLDGSQSQPGSSPIDLYSWSFGDGSSAEGAMVTHIYPQPGTYEVTLTVRDQTGLSSGATAQIAVREPEPENTPTPGLPPEAVILVPPAAGVGDEVILDGSQSQPGASPIVIYDWDLGDGASAQGAVVAHSYGQPGTYQVTLSVRDEAGMSGSAVTQILVQEGGMPAPPAGLVGQMWRWTELNQDRPIFVPNPDQYTLQFYDDGAFDYQADCNSGTGIYAQEGDLLTLDLGSVPSVDCGQGSLSTQYLALLEMVDSFELDDGLLVFYLAGGAGNMVHTP